MKTVGERIHLCESIYMQTHTYVWVDLDTEIYIERYLCVNFKKNSKGVCLFIYMHMYALVCKCVHESIHMQNQGHISSAPFVPLLSPPGILLMPLWAELLWALPCLETVSGLFYPVKS